jgi:UPF0716 protein FxsA
MRLLLLLYPWLELLSLIQLGVETSVLFVMLWVIGMFLVGTALLRHVGTASLERLREAQRSGVLQQTFLVDDLAVCIAAVLLMIPGLLSDFFALVVLVGPLRRGLARALFGASKPVDGSGMNADNANSHVAGRRGNPDPVTLEGDFLDVTDDSRRDDP